MITLNLFGWKVELNKEEMVVGAFIQVPFAMVIGWWVLLTMPLSALLWAIGGSKEGEKIVRRLGVPSVTFLSLIAGNVHYWPCLISAALATGILFIGYDDDSAFYWFYKNVVKMGDFSCDFLTRLTAYMLYWAVFAVGIKYGV